MKGLLAQQHLRLLVAHPALPLLHSLPHLQQLSQNLRYCHLVVVPLQNPAVLAACGHPAVAAAAPLPAYPFAAVPAAVPAAVEHSAACTVAWLPSVRNSRDIGPCTAPSAEASLPSVPCQPCQGSALG